MEKKSFTIYYNGKNVAVSALEENTFLAQITYKPVYLKLTENNGKKIWIDVEMNKETSLSKEIGQLIEKHPWFSY